MSRPIPATARSIGLRFTLLCASALLATPALAANKAPETISYSSGKTIVKTGPQGDQVTLLDAQGQLAGESVCDAGSFAAYLSLFTALRDAARQGKQDALAATIAYPLRVNGGKVRSVRDDAALRKNFAQVFTGPVIAAIGKAEPAAVFCRNGQAMFGDGVVWAELRGKQARVVVINTGL